MRAGRLAGGEARRRPARILDPVRVLPEREGLAEAALAGGLVNAPAESDIGDAQTHVGEVNAFLVISRPGRSPSNT